MKAIVFHQFGLDHLISESHTEPPLEAGQVQVEVKAVSLNYRDLLMVRGMYNPKLDLPLIPCSDGSGIVRAVEAGVTRFQPGDRVCSQMLPSWQSGALPLDAHRFTLGGPQHGMLAEIRHLPENALNPMPAHLDFAEAACLPVAGLTAWNALTVAGRPGAQHRVLLLGTGGVSIAALQIAKGLGCQAVITSSSDEKLERAQSLGADHVINYADSPDWGKKVLSCVPEGIDVVVEVGGAGTFNQSVHAARPGGTIALIGVLSQTGEPINLTKVLMKNLRVQGLLVGSSQDFSEFSNFLVQHDMRPVIGCRFEGLESAREAFGMLAGASHFSKIVITL